ncbi:uncharacterized protein BXZ73DRAFT_88596 [Epithele typhae]|uniref:uncharacterized protein n=1 Tax=Epithele typhae TaxID=378194 RepID=UPI002007EDF9|nr:uncharacterized protein BXZ73DRAFT_88596 [Epithele typhae]KAH9940893.1 hypothetical protein BXZ73DRAFT_88596 [Epithele typhae]
MQVRLPTSCQSLLLLGLHTSFQLINWKTRQRTNVQMVSDEEEELWNGVVGVVFLTQRHFLVLKTHSLEVCTLFDDSQKTKLPVQMSAVVHTHFFPNTTFGGVSFSRPIIQPPSPADTGGDEITQASLSFLAYDVLRGLFHCHVDITIPTPSGTHKASPPLEVQVHLLAAHNMATPFPRSGFSRGARGFVLSCALGPTGQRGVWIERRRGEVRRVVYGFAAPAVPEGDEEVVGVALADGPNPEGIQPGTAISVINSELGPDDTHSSWISPPPRAIEGKEMYEVNSYDLRDDITHIALSETTGIIALGTRKGDIRVLGPVGILGVRRNGV